MISVVIPLFNRYDLTCQCLESLLVSPDFELILVDNGSTDDTRWMDVAVRNNQNMGFAHGCNQGARKATGEAVVFLNNDTICHTGWLDALRLALVEADVAGARLVDLEGNTIHAGVGVDFTRPYGLEAWNIPHDLGIGTYEVAAVTGACLAIRHDWFDRVGGFDEGYWNGYEDVDLCLKVKKAGGKIVYTPDSVVTHLESQSDRTQRFACVKENVSRLREKWEVKV